MLDERVIRATEMLADLNLQKPDITEAIDFYPDVWFQSPEIRCLSLGARGLLVDLICLGYLHNESGIPELSIETLTRLVGSLDTDDVLVLLRELHEHGLIFGCAPGFFKFLGILRTKLPIFIFEKDPEDE